MDIIKTGLGIKRTFAHANRLREIVGVFAKNGLDEFIIKSNLHKKIPGFVFPQKRIESALDDYDSENWWETIGYRLRKSFEELGPSFVKLGQLLASREDIFKEPFIKEMKKLQDQVKEIPWSQMKEVLEKDLGQKVEDVFSSIESKPIATASIGGVYAAKLKTGEKVVIKIRKPGIRKSIDIDFSLVKNIILQVEKVSEDFRYLGLSRVIDDFHKHISAELNFYIEQRNLEKIAKIIQKNDKNSLLTTPKCYSQLTTQSVLVLEHLEGCGFNTLSAADVSEELKKNIYECVHIFVRSMLIDGSFHADLHGGNFLLLKDNRIGIIDFGSVGTLTKKNRASLIAILHSLMTFNFDNLTYELLDVADFDHIPDYRELSRNLQETLSPYIGLSVDEINISELISGLTKTLASYKLFLPREWFIIFRAMMTLDGVGKSLGLNLNVFNLLQDDLEVLVKTLASKDELIADSLWFGRDVMNSLRILPKHISWFMRDFARKNYSLEIRHEGIGQGLGKIAVSIYFLGTIILGCVFFSAGLSFIEGSEVFSRGKVPKPTYIFWGLAFLILLHGFLRVFKRKD